MRWQGKKLTEMAIKLSKEEVNFKRKINFMVDVSVIIPTYNRKEQLKTALSYFDNKFYENNELIIVDDFSNDKTREILKQKIENLPHINVIYNKKNQGKGSSVAQGFSHISGDVVIIQDADLEYNPEEYEIMLRPILQGKADVVFGSRFRGEVTRVLYFWHYLGNKLLTLFSNMLSNINLTDMETCYKAIRVPILKQIILTSQRFGIEPELTAKLAKIPAIRIYEVPISYYGRTYEEGKKINWKDGLAAVWHIIRFNILV